MRKYYWLLATCVVLHISSNAQKTFTLEDLDKLTGLSDPRISPDGKTVLVTTSRIDYAANRRNSSLVAIDASTGKERVLTFDRASINHARWSPDGQTIAFLSSVGTGRDARFQLFVLPVAGGEAKKLTTSPTSISQFAWKPDGSAIAYVAEDEPDYKAAQEKGLDAFEG